MSFVSIEFLIFFVIFFVVYHALPFGRAQDILVVLGSYIFYAWWDWRFTPLLLVISLVNYGTALFIERASSRRLKNGLLAGALTVSFVALGFFKYFGFFVGSAAAALKALGFAVHTPTLQIILPLGISFMTFQGVAYVVDVWKGQHVAERDIFKFFAFKAFFPQLVAGPIERADHLLDQFHRPRSIDLDKVRRGIWLIVYGYFIKMVIADGLAPMVNAAFVANQPFGWSVILGTVAFGLQIYGDFCGYSLIAKGLALLLGFDLVWNFRFPYWSVSISDFWRRWHISLSNWLRDYLYIPLGGNRGSTFATMRNLLVTMTLGGLWHGASWNFVFWGLLHGLALAAWRLVKLPVAPVSAAGRAGGWMVTMLIVFAGWFLFRANSWPVLTGMVGALGNWGWMPAHAEMLLAIAVCTVALALFECAQLRKGDFFPLAMPRWVADLGMACLVVICLAMSRQHQESFIYFQF